MRIMTRAEADRILFIAVSMGEALLCCGAEVARVEDTVTRIVLAYGVDSVDVFSLPSTLFATVTFNRFETKTQSRRIRNTSTDMAKLDMLNELSREICANVPDPEVVEDRIDSILNSPQYPFALQVVAYALVAGGFTVFFGGSLSDGLAAGFIGAALRFVEQGLRRMSSNKLLVALMWSLSGGFMASMLVAFKLGEHIDMISIGCIMLFIPGVAFTNSIRDLFVGDTITGLSRFVEAIALAVIIALGFTLSGFYI